MKKMELPRHSAAIHVQKPRLLECQVDYMRFDSVTASWGDFPDPAEQAKAILESCEEDIDVARSLVAARFKFARDIEELRYWCQVEELLSKEPSPFNLNAPSDEEAQR